MNSVVGGCVAHCVESGRDYDGHRQAKLIDDTLVIFATHEFIERRKCARRQ